jgi:ornithine cyclodeaminase
VTQLGDILIGAAPGRTDRGQRVFVSPVGLGIEDVAAAARVYRHAAEMGIGTSLELWREPVWT